MSRQEERQPLSNRRQHDQRNTHNPTAPALDVQSRPTDGYVDPHIEPNDTAQRASRLANRLGALAEGSQQALPFMEQYAEEQYEQGELDALQGKEPSEGYYAIQAFEQTKGELTAHREFKQDMQEYYRQNRDTLDPEEFQSGLEQLTKEYMEGHTDNFISGFAPIARGLEQQMLGDYQNHLQEEHHKESLNMVGDFTFEETQFAIDNIIESELGEEGIHSVDDLLEHDPIAFDTFFNQESVREDMSSRLREVLTHAQEKGKDLGLTRNEVSERFVEFVSRKAVREGIPELLDVMYEEDEHGLTLAGSYMADEIAGSKDRAESVVEGMVEEAEKAREQRKQAELEAQEQQAEEEKEIRLNQEILNLSSIKRNADNPREAMEMVNDWKDDNMEWALSELSEAEFKTLNNLVGDVHDLEPEDTTIEDDPQALHELNTALIQGEEIDVDYAYEMKQNELISEETFWEYMTKNEELKAERREEGEFDNKDFSSFYNSTINSIQNYLYEVTEAGHFEDQEQAYALEEALQHNLVEYIHGHGEYPDPDTFYDEIVNPVLRARDQGSYEQLRSEAMEVEEASDEVEEAVDHIETGRTFDRSDQVQEDYEADQELSGIDSVLDSTPIGEGHSQQLEDTLDELGIDQEEADTFNEMPPDKAFSIINEGLEEGSSVEEMFTLMDDPDSPLDEETAEIYKIGYLVDQVVYPTFEELDGMEEADSIADYQNAVYNRLKEADVPRDYFEGILSYTARIFSEDR